MRPDRKAADSGTGLIFAMYNMGSLCALPFTGPTIDYFGRRVGIFVAGSSSLYEHEFKLLPAARACSHFILGIGASSCAVSGLCQASELAYLRRRGILTGLYITTW